MKILALNEGFASGFWDDIRGKNEKTISQFVLPIVFNKYKILPQSWTEIHSTRLKSKRLLELFIVANADGENDLTIICKSKGCYELFKLLKNV